jgi:hypothetical protein
MRPMIAIVIFRQLRIYTVSFCAFLGSVLKTALLAFDRLVMYVSRCQGQAEHSRARFRSASVEPLGPLPANTSKSAVSRARE